MATVIENIYNKFRNGDSLTDNELEIGINHFRPMSEMLFKSGPVFRLTAQEASRVADQLEGFKLARTRK